MTKKTIKELLTRLIDLQGQIAKEAASIPAGAINFRYRHLDSLKREANALWHKCQHWGKGDSISICTLEASVTTLIVLYPTHDEEIIELLVKRDFKDHKILHIKKVITGIPFARKDKKTK